MRRSRRYWHVFYSKNIELNNPNIYTEALKRIYYFLIGLKDKLPANKSECVIEWSTVESKFREIFRYVGDEAERCDNWLKLINREGYLGFLNNERCIEIYDDKKWFNEAMDCKVKWCSPMLKPLANKWIFRNFIRNGWLYTYEWRDKDQFVKSNWKRFNDAAAWYRFNLLNKVMSDREMICG